MAEIQLFAFFLAERKRARHLLSQAQALTLLVRMAARLMLSSSALSFTDSRSPSAGATSTDSTPADFAAVSHPEQMVLFDVGV